MKTETDDTGPDIFELGAWVREHARELYEATRYLHPENQHRAWLTAWEASKE